MGWRIIHIDKAEKISTSLNNLVVRHNKTQYHINLDEIDAIIIEDYKCIMTMRSLIEISQSGINLIITGLNKMPIASFQPLTNNSRTAKVLKEQWDFPKENKQRLWQIIITHKIYNQYQSLQVNDKDYAIIQKYLDEVELGDITNKEAQSSRVYFKKLFGSDFTRTDESIINYCLNYAYQVVRSQIAQEVVARGLSPAIGIFHRSEYNFYNLADDLIEVYRPIIEHYIFNLVTDEVKYLTPKVKEQVIKVILLEVSQNSKRISLKDSIPYYINDIINCLRSEDMTIKNFPVLGDDVGVS